MTGPTSAQVGDGAEPHGQRDGCEPGGAGRGLHLRLELSATAAPAPAPPQPYVREGRHVQCDGDGQGRVRQDGNGERDDLDFGPPSVNAGSALTVSAESSLTFSQATESGGTAPFTYSWNFGDGTPRQRQLEPLAYLCEPRQLHGDADGHRRQQADRHELGRRDGQRRGADGQL